MLLVTVDLYVIMRQISSRSSQLEFYSSSELTNCWIKYLTTVTMCWKSCRTNNHLLYWEICQHLSRWDWVSTDSFAHILLQWYYLILSYLLLSHLSFFFTSFNASLYASLSHFLVFCSISCLICLLHFTAIQLNMYTLPTSLQTEWSLPVLTKESTLV